ncbi:MAG: deoxyribodipyrimidine photo-lyase [Actinomycetota bacterium]|nr:deoxyribodipyrimidine photo-lyase [Actinomycetota bacterium]
MPAGSDAGPGRAVRGVGTTAVVLLTRDLRVHDNPALVAACATHERVLPLFVLDDRIVAGARSSLLADALGALRTGLRARGGDLVVRRGDPVACAVALARDHAADTVVCGRDVTAFAARRERRLAVACGSDRMALRLVDAVGVVAPGALRPASGDHYKVFTPYFRAWSGARWRTVLDPPAAVRLPEGVEVGALPPGGDGPGRPHPFGGGEPAARRRMARFLGDGLGAYLGAQTDLAADATSRLSADLHLGCLSALELATAARDAEAGGDAGAGGGAGGAATASGVTAASESAAAFARSLCWRDFFDQVLAARPSVAVEDYRPRRQPWRDDPGALAAWREGRTGVALVDAGMRQLASEGYLHNRVRLLVASYLTKQLGVHWREGADHFERLLVDADVANNRMNWQWAAGTGNDPRPNRMLSPERQAAKLDPTGAYVRRHLGDRPRPGRLW